MKIIDFGIVNEGISSVKLFKVTVNTIIIVDIVTPIKTLKISLVPVCLIIPRFDPTSQKHNIETIAIKGS